MAKCLGCLHKMNPIERCCGAVDAEILSDPVRMVIGDERWLSSTCPLRILRDVFDDNLLNRIGNK